MAAEKLTKHRLAQIIFTLGCLLIAFLWRTITYKDIDSITCIPTPKCSLFVNGKKITVTESEVHPGVYVIQPVPVDWDLKYSGEMFKNGDEVTLNNKSNNSNTKSTLLINDSLNIKIKR